MSDTKQVYAAISAVSAELAKSGISKSRNNDQQGYKFRGIDEVFNALAPMTASADRVVTVFGGLLVFSGFSFVLLSWAIAKGWVS